MINIKKCKKILTEKGRDFTDEEIREIMGILSALARIDFTNYIKTKSHE